MSKSRLSINAAASVAQVATSALSLLLIYRILMQTLTISQIGLWSLVMGSVNIARLSEFGIGGGVSRYVAMDREAGRTRMAATTISMTLVVVTVLVGGTCLLGYPLMARYLDHVMPVSAHGDSHALLRAAMVVVGLTPPANVFLTALEGCQRMYVRCILQATGNMVQLIATIIILPRMGVGGLGIPQVAQALFLLVGGGIMAMWYVRAPITAYFTFNYERLRAMIAYGSGVQFNGVAQMIFEPAVKVLLTSYGSIALTGYFDMANKVLLQIRSLVVAGYLALVPHIAARSAAKDYDPSETRETYVWSGQLLLFILLPYFAVMAAVLPVGLTLWKGHFDPTFLAMALAMHVGWFVNTLNPPSYLIYMALGRLRWNMASHAATGIIALVLGWIMGRLLGGPGVVFATVIALSVGSFVVVVMFHREYEVPWGRFVTARRLPGLALVALSLVASARIAFMPQQPGWPVLFGLPVLVGVAALVTTWLDPVRAEVMQRMGGLSARFIPARRRKVAE